MPDRACPRCGDPLSSLDTAAGSVWECRTHGVMDWYFEATAAHLRPPRPDRAPELPSRAR